MRRCTESDTHANTFSDPNRDSYADGNSNSNTERYCETYSDSAASPHARTTPLEVFAGTEISGGSVSSDS